MLGKCFTLPVIRQLGSSLGNITSHLNCSSRPFGTSTAVFSGFKRYDREEDSVRDVDQSVEKLKINDNIVLPFNKNYGKVSFPTLESHSQVFDGIIYTELPIVHVKSTSNNTIISLANGAGKILAVQSCGTVGFSNAKKGTNVAAQATAIALAGDALRKDVKTVRVCLRGIGPGRLPALKALELSGLKIVSITDTTRLAHNGNRPKKVRRI